MRAAPPLSATWAALLRRPRLLLVAFCLALWTPGFFSLPPGDRDESRFAQASRQMNETGDYVRIMNGTVPRNRKPIGIYWLQAPFARLAGPGLANPIWPYRLPSLLGGLLAVLATHALGRSLALDRDRAALAGAMLAACVLLTTETHIAKTDAALLACISGAMAVLARAWMLDPVATWQAGLFWLAVAAGILIKGPVAPMVLALTAASLCLWARRGAWLAPLRPLWGVPLMLAAVAPWFVAIGVATQGRFFRDALGGDLGGKLAGAAEAHGAPPGLHLLLLPLLAFPMTLPALAGLPTLWTDRRHRAVRFLAAWVVPSWLVFEAVPTKLPHYTLPLYPALFLLAARATGRPASRAVRRAGRCLLTVATLALAVASATLPVLLGAAWWLGVPACAMALAVGVLAWRGRLVWALCAAVPLYATILQVELPNLPPLWIGPRVVAALRRDWPAWNEQGSGLAVAGYAEPSLVFLAGTRTMLLPSGGGAAAALGSGAASLVVVSDAEMGRFGAAAKALNLSPHALERVSGFNPSRGRWVTLNLLVR